MRKIDYDAAGLPTSLGLRPEAGLSELGERLEHAFERLLAERLRVRVLGKYPAMTAAEYEWKLLELKRYFVMTAILRHVPMFSEQVDDIWHEMLMFTREYQQFCESFGGRMIHHAPHAGTQPMPGERAWFDWVYARLFQPTRFSAAIWRGFFRYPLPKDLVDMLQRRSKDELAAELFQQEAMAKNNEIGDAVRRLIAEIKQGMREANGRNEYGKWNAGSGVDPLLFGAGALLFYSTMDGGDFDGRMEEAFPLEERKRADSSGSSCGSDFYSGDDNGASDNGDGGGDGDAGGDGGDDSGGGSDGGGSDGGGSDGGGSSCSSGCGGGGGD